MPEPSIKLRPTIPAAPTTTDAEGTMFPYAELEVASNFSFLRGASHPDELIFRAAEMGYRAIAITDHNTLAGVVRAYAAIKQIRATGATPPKLLIGTRLQLANGPEVLVWAMNRAGYGRLCRMLTEGKRRTEKGQCLLYLKDLLEYQEDILAAVVADSLGRTAGVCAPDDCAKFAKNAKPAKPAKPAKQKNIGDSSWRSWRLGELGESFDVLHKLRDAMRDRLSLAVSCLYGPDDSRRLERWADVGRRLGIPLLATNGVYYHDHSRRALQDVLTCIGHGCTIDQAGYRLFPNGERYLKHPATMHQLFSHHPEAIARGIELADRCTFDLSELKYEYPHELVPDGQTATQYLAELAWAGAATRYPAGLPDKVRKQIEHELKLIAQLKFEAYFLTVYDLVRYARSRGILCQGRGSAANSAVCYCIGITSVDPARIEVLFERFISSARNEPPDIDVDFEHERREEVLQYLWTKYGRERCGMTAEVISYRGRSAVRDVGKAMGLSLDQVDQMARKLDWWHRGTIERAQIIECGLDPNDRNVQRVVKLTGQILGFPRHLSQHVGGMVMTSGPLCELVPIENAAMENRTVIEWDKDDIDEVGILKVDCLGLGMLTCISRALTLINAISDEATKRRSDEGGREADINGDDYGQSANISGSDCVAACDGIGARGVQNDGPDAVGRTVRPDDADAPGGGVDSLEHCRGTCKTEPTGLSEVFANRQGLVGRTGHTDGAFVQPATTAVLPTSDSTARRSRPYTSGVDSRSGTKINAPPPSSLRRFVAPSLRRSPLELHTVPPEDPLVYDMICKADTIGVFQIESRAQMSMLPRLKPRCFYDLVIEVAIVRPGPIQGDMVHPYLRRRNGQEMVEYPSEALRQVLAKTLGVPLFQEQAMRVAMVGAGFSAEEADQLRRAMAAWRKNGALEKFHDKIVRGMLANGYTPQFAEQCFNQIKGFGEYGFPESHAASFALLVYVSAWLKCYHPAAFAAALINSQPMGFYQPAQIVRDAREHGVEVRAVDVNFSDWDCSLEATEGRSDEATKGADAVAMRLGMRLIRGFCEADAKRIEEARKDAGRFESVEQFKDTTGLSRAVLKKLAEADAFASLTLRRREALWGALGLDDAERVLLEEPPSSLRRSVASSLQVSSQPFLPLMSLGREVMTDYDTLTLSLKQHPIALVRRQLQAMRVIQAARISHIPTGHWTKVAGLVLIRQRPGTASGVVFETLEDETGIVNLIIWPKIYEKYRPAARHAGLLVAEGHVQKEGQVTHLIARRLYDFSHLLAGFRMESRDFH